MISGQWENSPIAFAKGARVWLVAQTMPNELNKTVGKVRRAMFVRWLVLWPLTLGLILYPVSNGMLRATTVAAIAILWSGTIWFSWQVKWLRMISLGFPILLVIFVLLPGQPASRASLRQNYVHSLRSYESTRYVWGGENRLGIDCSGLVRKALITAAAKEAVQTLNPAPMRSALDLWWHDCSARALAGEHRQQTVRLFEAPAINGIDSSKLQPGDLAVTDDGVHVLAFLGGNEWIEADPDVKRVLVVTTPSTNTWFEVPVKVMRWQVLESTGKSER